MDGRLARLPISGLLALSPLGCGGSGGGFDGSGGASGVVPAAVRDDPTLGWRPLTFGQGESGIFLADPGSGSPVRLDDALLDPVQPTVSPDGQRVAFLQGGALWRVGTDGSGQTRVGSSDTSLAWPAFSPDGDAIAVIEADGAQRELLVVPLDGREPTTVRDPANAPVGAAERLSWRSR